MNSLRIINADFSVALYFFSVLVCYSASISSNIVEGGQNKTHRSRVSKCKCKRKRKKYDIACFPGSFSFFRKVLLVGNIQFSILVKLKLVNCKVILHNADLI